MKAVLAVVVLTAAVVLPAQAATETPVHITLEHGGAFEEQGRDQLKRLLVEYDLDAWIFTREVVIESRMIPHSHPVLTLNTRHLEDDVAQLATFIHEQLHWYLGTPQNMEARDKAIQAVKAMHPTPPDYRSIGTRSAESVYLHVLVNWLELDALRQILGEDQAREAISNKDFYRWIYQTVLEDDAKLRELMQQHGLIVATAP